MSHAGGDPAVPLTATAQKRAQLIAAEADLRSKQADLRSFENVLYREKDALYRKEDELRAAKKAKPGRLGQSSTRSALDQAIAKAEQSLIVAKAAVIAAQAPVDLLTALVVTALDKVNTLQNEMAPKQFVNAATWLTTSLPPHSGAPSGIVPTKFSRESFACSLAQTVMLWDDFDPNLLLTSLGDLQVEKPPELPAVEGMYRVINKETGVLRMIGPVLELILFVFKQAFPSLGFNRVRISGSPSEAGKGGTTDDCMEILLNDKWHVIFVAEHKTPAERLEQSNNNPCFAHKYVQDQLNNGDTSSAELVTLQHNVLYTVTQIYTYMLSKGGLVYACFGNYDTWCFAMRKHDEYGNEVLLLSPYYHMREPPARLAFAYFLHLAVTAFHEKGSSTLPVGTGIVQVTSFPNPSECMNVPRYEAIPVTSTTEALGAPLMLHSNSVQLARSDKSVVLRGTVQGRDVVWRSVDLHGLPKHDKDWPIEAIEQAMENEVRVYDSLRDCWGLLVPHFVMRGPDFNFMWVTVTTYEGVSLQRLADEQGGLTLAVKAGALRSLSQLHTRGVIHGNMEVRNAVWRAKDGLVLWVDLEFASLRQDLEPNAFDKWEHQEIKELEYLLSEIETLSEASSVSSTLPIPERVSD